MCLALELMRHMLRKNGPSDNFKSALLRCSDHKRGPILSVVGRTRFTAHL